MHCLVFFYVHIPQQAPHQTAIDSQSVRRHRHTRCGVAWHGVDTMADRETFMGFVAATFGWAFANTRREEDLQKKQSAYIVEDGRPCIPRVTATRFLEEQEGWELREWDMLGRDGERPLFLVHPSGTTTLEDGTTHAGLALKVCEWEPVLEELKTGHYEGALPRQVSPCTDYVAPLLLFNRKRPARLAVEKPTQIDS